MFEIKTNALETVAQQYAERMDAELRGAWRAGYSYVHVYTSRTELQSWRINVYIFPAKSASRPDPGQLTYVKSYDLSSVDAERVRELTNT